jgi:hypothetical protein
MFSTVSIAGISGMFILMGVIRASGRGGEIALSRPRPIAGLAWFATLLAAIALAATGFGGPLLQGGQPLSGMLLLAHTTAGSLFIAGLVGMALFRAESCRFGGTWGAGTLRKAFFWCILALGLAATLAIMFSMTPLFSSEGIKVLSDVHRWSALLAVLALIGYGLGR